MNLIRLFFLSIFLLNLNANCVVAEEIMLSGKYTTANSQEFIVISGNKIEFHLYDSERKAPTEKQYKYSLLPDGRIQPYPVTSADAVFGVGRYDWYLEEGNISMKNPKTGELLVFELKK